MPSGAVPVNASDLDPILTQLGLTVGLLSGEGDTLTLNLDWTSDPLQQLEQIPSQRSEQLLSLLEMVLGAVDSSALGTPITTLDRTWYPINNPETSPPTPTGVYIVSQEPQAGDTYQNKVFGLGLLREFTAGIFTFTPYAYFPLMTISPTGTVQSVFQDVSQAPPVEAGVEITGPSGGFTSGDLSFDGIKAQISITFDGQLPQPSLVILNLKLPGSPAADQSIQQLIETVQLDVWAKIALALLGGQLTKNPGEMTAAEIEAMFSDLLLLLGL